MVCFVRTRKPANVHIWFNMVSWVPSLWDTRDPQKETPVASPKLGQKKESFRLHLKKPWNAEHVGHGVYMTMSVMVSSVASSHHHSMFLRMHCFSVTTRVSSRLLVEGRQHQSKTAVKIQRRGGDKVSRLNPWIRTDEIEKQPKFRCP